MTTPLTPAEKQAKLEAILNLLYVNGYEDLNELLADLVATDDIAELAMRHVVATYDFAVDGGAIGAHAIGAEIPIDAIIIKSFYDVETTFTTAGADAGTIALAVKNANDIVAAIAVSNGGNPWDAGLHATLVLMDTIASTIKLAVANQIDLTIAGQAVTAGKLHVHSFYVLPEASDD